MAKINRYSGNLQAFASGASLSDRKVFNDTVNSDNLTTNINASFLIGWRDAVPGVNDLPSIQDFQAIFFTHGQLISYLHQVGVIEWDNAQEYHQYSYTNYNGKLYKSLINTNTGNQPDSSPTEWQDTQASASISYDNTISGLLATDAQSAIDEVDGDIDAHIASSTAHAAEDITYDNTLSGLAATDAKAAIDELDDRLDQLQGRNAIINGRHQIVQRGGTSFTNITTTPTYFIDRHAVSVDDATGASLTVSQQKHTLGQTDVPGEPEFFHRFAVTTIGSVTSVDVRQPIKGVRTFAGQTATLSFYVRTSVNSNIRTIVEQNFGTGGSPSATVTVLDQNTATTANTWQKITFTINVNSISGKTIGNINDNLQVIIRCDSGLANGVTFDLSDEQFEKGGLSTNFESLSDEEMLDKCLPYYEKSYNKGVAPGTIDLSGRRFLGLGGGQTIEIYPVEFRVKKISTPVVTIYSPNTGSSGQVSTFAGDQVAAVTSAGETGFNASNAGTLQIDSRIHFTAESEIPA